MHFPTSNIGEIFLLCSSIIFLLVFLSFIWIIAAHHQEIREHYCTISSFCAMPDTYGHRALIFITTLIGVNLAWLKIAEYRELHDVGYTWIIVWIELVAA